MDDANTVQKGQRGGNFVHEPCCVRFRIRALPNQVFKELSARDQIQDQVKKVVVYLLLLLSVIFCCRGKKEARNNEK
jgi:hypothetical protein